jgi:ribosomal protein L15
MAWTTDRYLNLKFNKTLSELSNEYEKWLYAFKNLHRLRKMPQELEANIFNTLFELAEIANFKHTERVIYEDSLKDYRDLKTPQEPISKKAERKVEQKADQKASAKKHLKLPKICYQVRFQMKKLPNLRI